MFKAVNALSFFTNHAVFDPTSLEGLKQSLYEESSILKTILTVMTNLEETLLMRVISIIILKIEILEL